MRDLRSSGLTKGVLGAWLLCFVAGPVLAMKERSSEEFYRNKKRALLDTLNRMEEGKGEDIQGFNSAQREGAEMAVAGHGVPGSDYYNKAAANPELKGRVIEQLQKMATLSAMARGTVEHDRAQQNMADTATALQGSKDPTFQAMGRDFSSVSSAMQSGNVDGAQRAAQRINTSYHANYNPNYKMSSDENQFMSFLGNLGVQLAMSLTGIFGQALMGKMMGSLFGNASKWGLDQLGSTIAEDTMGAALDGKNSKAYSRSSKNAVSGWGKNQARSGAGEVKALAKDSAFGSNRNDGGVNVDPGRASGSGLSTSK